KVRVEIERRSSGGIQVFCSGRFLNCSLNDIVDLIRDYGFNNAVVRIWGDVKLEDVEKYVALNLTYKPSIIIANKCDLRGSGEKFKRLKETLNGIIKVLPFSCIYYEKYVKYVKKEIFDLLGVIRVFTKEVGGEIAEKPLIVPKGTRVIDVARMIHSRLYREFKYAKVWGVSVRFNGQRVGADHVLSDGDIVEIRTK
ncbi:MAG: TGS domain-containing protein, partial [archaeon GB-1867-097]|nr:TGS domain-containing protein [Candidatus Culexmicrobium thermophilum]